MIAALDANRRRSAPHVFSLAALFDPEEGALEDVLFGVGSSGDAPRWQG